MNEVDVEAIGVKYYDWLQEASRLKLSVEKALQACQDGEVDPGFGRDLAAAAGVLAGVPGVQ